MSTITEITAQIMPILTKMAEGLGVASSHLYAVLVKQAFISGAYCLFIFGFFFISSVLMVYCSIKFSNKLEDEVLVVIRGAALFLMVISLFFGYPGVTNTLNPEYAAISDIIYKLHGN